MNLLYPYQVTALLSNAQRMTGLPFALDPELDSGEFVIESTDDDLDEVTRFLVPAGDPWASVVTVVAMLRITESRWRYFFSGVPIVGWVFRWWVFRGVTKEVL